jgi:hypothetical protein
MGVVITEGKACGRNMSPKHIVQYCLIQAVLIVMSVAHIRCVDYGLY